MLNGVKYVTIKKMADFTGYTETAIRCKISNNIWREGFEWIRSPDNKPLISIKGYNEWVENLHQDTQELKKEEQV